VTQFVGACPKDGAMFSDAVKTARMDGRLAVRDITMLVQEAMLGADRARAAGTSADDLSVQERNNVGAGPEMKP
jgi:hypothetical protein